MMGKGKETNKPVQEAHIFKKKAKCIHHKQQKQKDRILIHIKVFQCIKKKQQQHVAKPLSKQYNLQ